MDRGCRTAAMITAALAVIQYFTTINQPFTPPAK